MSSKDTDITFNYNLCNFEDKCFTRLDYCFFTSLGITANQTNERSDEKNQN